MAKRIVTKIGDVFCVEIDRAYKRYFQYFCNDMTQLNSSVIRIFKTRFPMDYRPNLEEIVSDEVDFYAHTILRNGIEDGLWQKIGKINGDFSTIMDIPIFGTCQSVRYIDGENIYVDPNSNWYIWKINQPSIEIGTLPRHYLDIVERGTIFSDVEIINRIRLGYYKWTSPAYDSLKRIPYIDTNSYVVRKNKDVEIYMHFLGENAVRRIEMKTDGSFTIERGTPLPLPKFWETNWKHPEFISEEEFNEVWEKCNSR